MSKESYEVAESSFAATLRMGCACERQKSKESYEVAESSFAATLRMGWRV